MLSQSRCHAFCSYSWFIKHWKWFSSFWFCLYFWNFEHDELFLTTSHGFIWVYFLICALTSVLGFLVSYNKAGPGITSTFCFFQTGLFNCPECGRSFSRTYNLIRHMRGVHQGCRDFVCAHCGRTFTQKVHLKKHQCNHAAGFVLPYDLGFDNQCLNSDTSDRNEKSGMDGV